MTVTDGFQTLVSRRGTELDYLLGLPENFDTGQEYPVILSIPPGDQTRDVVDVYEKLFRYFTQRNWAVVCPISPDGKTFFQGSDRYLPPLMDFLQPKLRPTAGRFYLFGVSNGGISAFRAATLNPDRFHSITVMPGWPKPADEKRLDRIIGIPINFAVGENDDRWRKKTEEFVATLAGMGATICLELIPQEGHHAFDSYPPEKLEQLFLRK